MQEATMEDASKELQSHIVEVELNQQQEVILKQLAQDGKYGQDYSEIIRNVFQEFLRQTRL
jgi:Arc/MetJ-type ribon-helix-helix transcriptional regulator